MDAGLRRSSMSTLLLTAVLAAAPGQAPAAKAADAAPDLGGKWQIVYAEEKGRRIQSWERQAAAFKDGALTYERDGKEHTIHLKFGAHQTVKATGGKAEGGPSGESDGVYIASQDYVAISLSGGTFTGGDKGAKEGAEDKKGHSSGDFILILRKQRAPVGAKEN
jgi:hypothetical protein